ncbi:MAG TPA: GNAT family N-acetyltransferase [Sphingopyxis sp.]|uniref:GNAT family N-acetyltransferase n=1 Tax=Sphingopyxis sp. TaxID=1908224 RepID=UPI002B6B13A4|nr:GNAT family N-acetyltransferase [Sphingopyxis sp.]HWW56575.1 GNAT family N-acetyltransferase [Sphingopyxis sp.]
MDAEVFDNREQRSFELDLPDGSTAAAFYRIDEEGRLVLIHTEVPPEFWGMGIATQLATGAFQLMRQTGRKAVLRCQFMANFFRRHPEYADVVAG